MQFYQDRSPEKWEQLVRDKTIEKKFPTRIVKDLKHFRDCPIKLSQPDSSYFIYGKVDTGKTILACQLLLEQLKNTYLYKTLQRGAFIGMADLLYEIKQSYDDSMQSNPIPKYTSVDFLVLDDLGAEKANSWGYEMVYYLINYRYEWMKPTIITSNFSCDQLAERYEDERIPSRIKRMCQIISKD